jgi:hypothetical protein
MLVSKKLVFLELQKTGSTHIKQLLKKTIGGKNDGKHNQATPELRESGKAFIGSIREPWGWYLSLYTYGCQKKGGVYLRTTNPARWKQLRRGGTLEGAPAGFESYGAPYMREEVYADPDSAEHFRAWLRLVLTTGPHRALIEEGYAESPISKFAGLMTYRYFLLFADGGAQVPETVNNVKKLQAHEKKNLFIRQIIRNETLAEDLIQAVEACGETLTDEQKSQIREAPRTNTSPRKFGKSHYYDDECIALVAEREKFIIDKFDYVYKP